MNSLLNYGSDDDLDDSGDEEYTMVSVTNNLFLILISCRLKTYLVLLTEPIENIL